MCFASERDAAARITPEGPQLFLPYIFQWQSTLADIATYRWKQDSDHFKSLAEDYALLRGRFEPNVQWKMCFYFH